MTADTLSMLAGGLLSLIFTFAPGLKGWYASLGGVAKRVIMFALVSAIGAGSFYLACAGLGPVFRLALTCDESGIAGLLRAIALAVVFNQSTYLISQHGREKVPPAGLER